MNKIELNVYYSSAIYFHFFDAYIKTQDIKKDILFKELDINDSSYRRCREKEQNVGKTIIEKLASHFKLKLLNQTEIEMYENYLNDLYVKIYYKDDENYNNDLEKIEKIIEEKNILFPIFRLMRLLLIANSKKSIEFTYNNYNEEFNYLKKYKRFYDNEINVIFNILSLFFEENSNEYEWNYNFNNALAYQILSSKCYKDKKYIEAIFFSTKAKEILLTDYNYKRIIAINRTIMASLLYIGNYDEVENIASKQIRSFNAMNITGFELKAVKENLNIALLGKKEWKKVIENLENQKKVTLTDIICILIAKYKTDKVEYNNYFTNEIMTLDLNEEYEKIFKSLNHYLNCEDRKLIPDLMNAKIHGVLKNILKKI